MRSVEQLEQAIGYEFKDKAYITLALTHPSYKQSNNANNQRLEFLGDAVLELCVSEYLYNKYPELDEGEMSLIRSRAVCEQALYDVAGPIELGEYIRFGKGEQTTGGKGKPSVLSDALEAVIGAIYLDAGLEQAQNFVNKFAPKSIEESIKGNSKDFKTLLQENLQQNGTVHIEYNIIKNSGPDHAKEFVVEVRFLGKARGKGSGKSKKQAEQMAAEQALKALPQQSKPAARE